MYPMGFQEFTHLSDEVGVGERGIPGRFERQAAERGQTGRFELRHELGLLRAEVFNQRCVVLGLRLAEATFDQAGSEAQLRVSGARLELACQLASQPAWGSSNPKRPNRDKEFSRLGWSRLR